MHMHERILRHNRGKEEKNCKEHKTFKTTDIHELNATHTNMMNYEPWCVNTSVLLRLEVQ
jgi:hypothetical protein